jgi:hypothetical protein
MPETCLGPVCGWIHVLSLWLKVHILPFAPVITVVVAVVAGVIAVYSIHVTRSVARKRAAVDFFLKTDMDAGMVTAYAAFQDALIAWEKHLKENKPVEKFIRDDTGAFTKGYRDITSYLNIHELVAVGIKNKVFDGNVCYNFWSDALVRHTDKTQKLIEYEVASDGGAASYLELRLLSEKWKKRIEKWQKKQAKKQGQLPKLAPPAPVSGQSFERPSQETIVGHPPPRTAPAAPPPSNP